MFLGSTGCQPVVAGSLPATSLDTQLSGDAIPGLGKLPRPAGWQPALPSTHGSRYSAFWKKAFSNVG